MKDNEFLGELGWFRDKGKGLHGWKSPKIEGRYLVVLDRDGQVHGVRGDSEVVFRTENPDGVSVEAILTMQASWTYGATVPADVLAIAL